MMSRTLRTFALGLILIPSLAQAFGLVDDGGALRRAALAFYSLIIFLVIATVWDLYKNKSYTFFLLIAIPLAIAFIMNIV